MMGICLLAGLQTVKAQTEAETLEWLNVKKSEISLSDYNGSHSNVVSSGSKGKTLLFDSDIIKLASTDDESWTTIIWKNIKDFKMDDCCIDIVSDKEYLNKKTFIRLAIWNSEMRGKYLKALRNMAVLKGATLIKDDLF